MYFFISYNHWDIRLKPMQKEPSWSYVLHFIICFPHFSFSAIWQACFHVRQKLVSLHNHSISQALFRFAKKCHGQVFKQLSNHSFIFNSYEIIHSLPALSCCWSKLLFPDPTVNWFLILLSCVKTFPMNETEI